VVPEVVPPEVVPEVVPPEVVPEVVPPEVVPPEVVPEVVPPEVLPEVLPPEDVPEVVPPDEPPDVPLDDVEEVVPDVVPPELVLPPHPVRAMAQPMSANTRLRETVAWIIVRTPASSKSHWTLAIESPLRRISCRTAIKQRATELH